MSVPATGTILDYFADFILFYFILQQKHLPGNLVMWKSKARFMDCLYTLPVALVYVNKSFKEVSFLRHHVSPTECQRLTTPLNCPVIPFSLPKSPIIFLSRGFPCRAGLVWAGLETSTALAQNQVKRTVKSLNDLTRLFMKVTIKFYICIDVYNKLCPYYMQYCSLY